MPGNVIKINGSWREYYVGDSKMDGLLKWLDKNGCPIKGESCQKLRRKK